MDLVDMLPRPNEAVKQAQERKDRVLTTLCHRSFSNNSEANTHAHR